MGQKKSESPTAFKPMTSQKVIGLKPAGDMLIILFSQKGNGFKIQSVGNNLYCTEARTLSTRNQTNIILVVSSAGLEKNLEFQLIFGQAFLTICLHRACTSC